MVLYNFLSLISTLYSLISYLLSLISYLYSLISSLYSLLSTLQFDNLKKGLGAFLDYRIASIPLVFVRIRIAS
jgi:hypothetical protein